MAHHICQNLNQILNSQETHTPAGDKEYLLWIFWEKKSLQQTKPIA